MLRVITGNAYHFNPLPPHGGRRPKKGHKKIPPNLFQSTPSAWRETRIYNVDFYILPLFQSTPSAWRETMRTITSPNNKHISIHSLRMEGDHKHDGKHKGLFTFQSTPSAWRETSAESVRNSQPANFNPLPPHGGRHTPFGKLYLTLSDFNPLPPHGGIPQI